MHERWSAIVQTASTTALAISWSCPYASFPKAGVWLPELSSRISTTFWKLLTYKRFLQQGANISIKINTTREFVTDSLNDQDHDQDMDRTDVCRSECSCLREIYWFLSYFQTSSSNVQVFEEKTRVWSFSQTWVLWQVKGEFDTKYNLLDSWIALSCFNVCWDNRHNIFTRNLHSTKQGWSGNIFHILLSAPASRTSLPVETRHTFCVAVRW